MEILVAILIIALIGAIAYIVMQRRPGANRGLGQPGAAPVGLRRRGPARHDPMAAAVAEHAQAMHPADVVVAEERLQAEARRVAAGLHANAQGGVHPGAPIASAPGVAPAAPGAAYANDPSLAEPVDPATSERAELYRDPATDPRYNDPRYDGRLAADWVDPREDERYR